MNGYRQYAFSIEHWLLILDRLQVHLSRGYHVPIQAQFKPESTHQLHQILRRPPRLRKAQTPLDTLQKLPRHLIAHDVRRRVALVQLLPRTPLVDADHGHPDRPRRLADRQPQVAVVGVHVAPLLRRHHDLHHGRQDPLLQLPGLELAEQRRHVRARLRVGAVGLPALLALLDAALPSPERPAPLRQHHGEVRGQLPEEEGPAVDVLGERGRDFHLGFREEGERGGDGPARHGGRGGAGGDEPAVAAQALDVGLSEEEGGFGEGAQFGHEVRVWHVRFAAPDRRPILRRRRFRQFGQSQPFPPRPLSLRLLFLPPDP